jgi:hypothetical protein
MKKLADQIAKSLKKHGFILQRYNSHGTNSIYLKLDYGVSHSLRISDHRGKKHLSYRFNLLTDIDKSYTEKEEYERRYYCKSDIEKLISDVLEHRDKQIARYGSNGYVKLMKKNQLDNADKKGFWKQAVLI